MLHDLVRDDFFLVDKRDELRNVLGHLRGEVPEVPIVADEGRPFGVLNEKRMMRSRIEEGTKLENYVVGTKVLSPHASLETAIDVCLTSGLRRVPVADEGEAVGYVEARDLLEALVEARGGGATARDLMARVAVVEEDDPAGQAVKVLRESSEEAVPVVDGSGAVAGVLRRRALLAAELQGDMDRGVRSVDRNDRGEQVHRLDIPVRTFMESRFRSVGPKAPLEVVLEGLRGFDEVVVVEGERPVGIVSPVSALRALARRTSP